MINYITETVIKEFLRWNGLAQDEVPTDISLFRLGNVDVNLGLINTEHLSIQVQIVHAYQPSKNAKSSCISVEGAEQYRSTEKKSEWNSIPIKESPFETTSTFHFTTRSIFDESKLTINTIPIHFLRAGDRQWRECQLRLGGRFVSGVFKERSGKLCMNENLFCRYELSKQKLSCSNPYEDRVHKLLVDSDRTYFYKHGHVVVGILPAETGEELPLGKDSAVFSKDIVNNVYLICVATQNRRKCDSFQIRSHFYFITERKK